MAKGDRKPGTGKQRGALRVLVVRHAIAKDPVQFATTGAADAERPLTKDGEKKMRRAAKGLVMLAPDVRLIATSPLVRAVETAEILSKQYEEAGREPETVRLSALAPGKAANLLMGWLAEQSRDHVVALVGHEPHLGQFVSWTLTGLRESFVELKKGAACLLEFEDAIRPGRAKLLWALRPGQLRAIGKACEE